MSSNSEGEDWGGDFGASLPKFEPTQEWRAIAKVMRNAYVSLIDEGFTEDQTFRLMAQFMMIWRPGEVT